MYPSHLGSVHNERLRMWNRHHKLPIFKWVFYPFSRCRYEHWLQTLVWVFNTSVCEMIDYGHLINIHKTFYRSSVMVSWKLDSKGRLDSLIYCCNFICSIFPSLESNLTKPFLRIYITSATDIVYLQNHNQQKIGWYVLWILMRQYFFPTSPKHTFCNSHNVVILSITQNFSSSRSRGGQCSHVPIPISLIKKG